MAQIEGVGGAFQQAYLAGTMYKQATWIQVMAAAFKEADAQRAQLDVYGPWTARTANIQRYATRFEVYA